MDAHRQNKFADAERAYGAILDVAPDCFEALHFLGLAYLQQNKLPQALDVVSRALKAKPQAADSLAMRGVVLSNLGVMPRRLSHRMIFWRCVRTVPRRTIIAAFRWRNLISTKRRSQATASRSH
jgi:tetratricopeptide (TPR) repeat protein